MVFDKRSKTWHFIWWEDGKRRSRRIGLRRAFRTKASAWKAAQPFVSAMGSRVGDEVEPITLTALVELYRQEKMPRRYSTRRGYESWLKNHVLPKWGELSISDLQARPVELWLQSLPVSPKSKAHIRGMLRILWEYAMWRGVVPTQRNPIELVTVKGATKRTRQPRSLTVEEFRSFVSKLEEPVRTIALICVCFGLRISECLALKWGDVNWLCGKLRVERAIVHQRVDEVKTVYSGKTMSIDAEILAVLKTWKQTTEFTADEDWMFASPVQLGRLPFSYPWVWQMFQKAAAKSLSAS